MTSDAFDLAIIGDGLAAAVLVTRICHRRVPARIAIIGDSGAVGYGRAYGEPATSALINAPVTAMAIPDVQGFDEWLRVHRPAIHASGADYVPRKVFGDYAAHQFAVARRAVEDMGGTVEVFVDHANRLDRIDDDLWRTHGRDGTEVLSRRVALCVGTAEADSAGRPLVTTSGYVDDPYPLSDLIARTPTGATVATLGAGLSAIDVALTVHDRAPTSSMILTSRSGLLPTIRGVPAPEIDAHSRTVLQSIRTDARFDLERYAALVDRCIADSVHAGDGWRGLDAILTSSAGPLGTSGDDLRAGSMRPATTAMATAGALLRATGSVMWQRISATERARFNAEWRPRYHRLSNPMPMRTAVVLADMVRDGALMVVENPAVRIQDRGYRIHTGTVSVCADIIVNTTGFSRTQIPSNARALVGRLTSLGRLENSVWGGIRVHAATPYAVVDSQPSRELFVVGQMSSGDRFLSNSIGTIAADCDFVADVLERNLHARVPTH